MRNKIHLYIEGQRADLDEGSFLLLNYTAEDLSNPVVVRNSFSKQITLKGTPANDAIFGHIYRNDRNTLYGSPYTGPNFDPCRKTSFVLYNDANEIIESGYLKLDSIEQTRRKRSYKVTLYGGLGSFLYGLSYKANGDKMTLADLDFGETLDFTIDRKAVSDAWARIGGDGTKSAKWDILNFIPSYSGLPSGEFNADKAVVHAASCGLPTQDGYFKTQDGWTLVSLTEKVTGNEAKDFRSYLQKPCVRMKAIINAIANSSNNGGYTVNLDSEFFDDSNPYWDKTWLTLPMLQELNIDESKTTWDTYIYDLADAPVPSGGNISTLYNINLVLFISFGALGGDYKMDCEDDWAAGSMVNDNPGMYLNYIEAKATVYDANNNILGTEVRRGSTAQAPPEYDQMTDIYTKIDSTGKPVKAVEFYPGESMVFKLSYYGASKVSVSITRKALSWGNLRASGDATLIWPDYSYDYTDGIASTFTTNGGWNGAAIASGSVRTGASITKAALLSTENTPADYLLSFCKMFGLMLVAHRDSKTVDVVLRKNLYSSTVLDISGRIDRASAITKKPFSFDARWYKWQTPHAGEWPEHYANKYGQTVGQYRINTGYEFDASEKSLTDGIVFNGAATVLETSKYFCVLERDTYIPSLFIGGGKYTLYNGAETKEMDIPIPTQVTKTWDNASYNLHDNWPKLQFHKEGNAHLEERDTLVFFNGVQSLTDERVSLTDDTVMMIQLNGAAPCWLPGYCNYYYGWRLDSMPQFTRYVWSGTNATKALDFGLSLEVQMPGASFNSAAPVFPQYWERYIADRYDDDSAVVTCYVDLRGFQVNENLLRQFYAFDGAIWALNRIIDHSLTTNGPTKCEFVKVQDKTNYTTY